MYLECCVCADSPVFYEHWGCKGGQVFSSHQLQHQWVGLWVDAAGLGGQQARLGSIAEQVWQELVVCGHGSVDVLIPEGRRVAVHFHRATGGTKQRLCTLGRTGSGAFVNLGAGLHSIFQYESL